MEISNEPIWKGVKKHQKFPKLEANIQCDVVVIGGGLAGVTTAYMLAQEGKDVILIEAKEIGSGATGYTTAMISQVIDTGINDLVKMYGRGRAGLVWQAGADAISKIKEIIDYEKIDCEFNYCNAYAFAAGQEQVATVVENFTVSKELGFPGQYNKQFQCGIKHNGVWVIPNQAKFNPLKFLYQLSDRAADLGVKIFEHSEAKDIIDNGKQVVVKTKSGQITAKQSVMATYRPFKNPIQTLFKKGTYKTYELSVKIPKQKVKEGLYWDQNNPYNFFRVDPKDEYDLLTLGGADHRSEIKLNAEKAYGYLEEYLKQIIPNTKYEVVAKWDGPIIEPSDGLALIGKYRPNQYIATAFSGNGMTYSIISGKLLTDLIMNLPSPYAKLFDPKRIPTISQLFQKGMDYSEELIQGAGKLIFKKQQPSH